jgi:hypothetical protein
MFKHVPLVGIAQVRQAVERIEENWCDTEIEYDSALARRDIFELLGVCKGLMMALDSHVLRQGVQPEDEQ